MKFIIIFVIFNKGIDMNKYLNFFILLLSIFFVFLNCNISKIDATVDPFGTIYTKEPVLVQITEISVNHEVSDDLRISWKFDPEHEFIFSDTKHIFVMFEMITKENERYIMMNGLKKNNGFLILIFQILM